MLRPRLRGHDRAVEQGYVVANPQYIVKHFQVLQMRKGECRGQACLHMTEPSICCAVGTESTVCRGMLSEGWELLGMY